MDSPAGGKGQGFSFDHVFGPSTSQAAVFAQVSELVQSALDGYQVGAWDLLQDPTVQPCSAAAS